MRGIAASREDGKKVCGRRRPLSCGCACEKQKALQVVDLQGFF
jgi:hypothetical protein